MADAGAAGRSAGRSGCRSEMARKEAPGGHFVLSEMPAAQAVQLTFVQGGCPTGIR